MVPSVSVFYYTKVGILELGRVKSWVLFLNISSLGDHIHSQIRKYHPNPDNPQIYTTNPNLHHYIKAAAKSLQLCPTLCDPTDSSPPGSAVPGILQARTREWVAISFSNAWMWKVKVKSLSRVWLFGTSWTAAHQAPPSMGFSRQKYQSWVPLPSPYIKATLPQSWFLDLYPKPARFSKLLYALPWGSCHQTLV